MTSRCVLKLSISALAFAACVSTPVFAQTPEPMHLGTIVVVGTGLPSEIRDNPASVSAIDDTDIRRVPPSSVARILEQVPGVRVTQSGIERITIRGESSQRVSIMIDGQALTDHTGYGTPILVSPANIERIEIVRGSSSVVSGNSSIGGVVNIITKRGADKPIELDFSSAYFSATNGHRTSLSAGGTTGNFDYRLTASRSDFGDVQTPDGSLDNSDINDRELSAFLGYRTGNHYFGLRAQDFDLAANVYTGDPDFTIELPKRDLRKYGAFYEVEDVTPWLNRLKIDAYKQEIDREFRNDMTIAMGPGMSMNVTSTSEDLQETWGLNAMAEMAFAPGHRTIVGFGYENDSQIADKATIVTTPFGPPSSTLRYSDASIRTFSIYAQHEMALSDKLTGTLGARYYKVDSDRDTYRVNGVDQGGSSNSDDRLLGALGLVYKPSEDVTFRANLSQGYKYPTLSQLYLQTSAGSGGLTIGNPNLEAETSTTYEIGARLDRNAFSFDGTLFYSDSENYITTMPTGNPSEFTYENVNSAKTWGIEISAEYQSTLWELRPYAKAEYLQREFTYSNGYSTKDSGTPEFAATLGLRRDWSLGSVSGEWDLFVMGESKATLRDASGNIVNQADAYKTVNFRASADINDQFSLNFVAGNLLDESYQPINQYDGAGRNFSVVLNAKF
ncbi:MAG: TonB-dependent receptor [Pelagimonas sp.]|uniref:TonB-dependent receptor n=1 Tax=Pelagimonas sp. TaxID=2073170 RepID=UPI003D6B2CCD